MRYLIAILLTFIVGCASTGKPGAIGVLYNQEGIVRQVFPNSPAEKAGIMINDKILNPKDLRGKIGTYALVKFVRQGATYELRIVRMDVDKLEQGSW